jgi:hypothetical protein
LENAGIPVTLTVMRDFVCKPKKTRKLVLLDIENLAGSGLVSSTMALQIVKALHLMCPIELRDIVFVGSHKGNVEPCSLVARMLHGSMCLQNGPDGAELALLRRAEEVTPAAYTSEIYPISECVIGSGDHMFVDHALIQKEQGRSVTVISRSLGLSSKLAAVANRIIIIDGLEIEYRKAV